MFKVFTTMPHVTFGVWGIIMAVWAVVELLNLRQENLTRLRTVSLLTTIFIWVSYITGGWWYWVYYPEDKAIIKEGAFPAAHGFYMEVKEHLFFMVLLASMLLVVVTKSDKLLGNKAFKRLGITVALLVVILGFGMEFFGSVITKGVKIGLLGY